MLFLCLKMHKKWLEKVSLHKSLIKHVFNWFLGPPGLPKQKSAQANPGILWKVSLKLDTLSFPVLKLACKLNFSYFTQLWPPWYTSTWPQITKSFQMGSATILGYKHTKLEQFLFFGHHLPIFRVPCLVGLAVPAVVVTCSSSRVCVRIRL